MKGRLLTRFGNAGECTNGLYLARKLWFEAGTISSPLCHDLSIQFIKSFLLKFPVLSPLISFFCCYLALSFNSFLPIAQEYFDQRIKLTLFLLLLLFLWLVRLIVSWIILVWNAHIKLLLKGLVFRLHWCLRIIRINWLIWFIGLIRISWKLIFRNLSRLYQTGRLLKRFSTVLLLYLIVVQLLNVWFLEYDSFLPFFFSEFLDTFQITDSRIIFFLFILVRKTKLMRDKVL